MHVAAFPSHSSTIVTINYHLEVSATLRHHGEQGGSPSAHLHRAARRWLPCEASTGPIYRLRRASHAAATGRGWRGARASEALGSPRLAVGAVWRARLPGHPPHEQRERKRSVKMALDAAFAAATVAAALARWRHPDSSTAFQVSAPTLRTSTPRPSIPLQLMHEFDTLARAMGMPSAMEPSAAAGQWRALAVDVKARRGSPRLGVPSCRRAHHVCALAQTCADPSCCP